MRKSAGFTLAELIIALTLLALVTGPILGMFVYSTRINALSYKMTVAMVIAQQRIEELVGLTMDEFKAQIGTDGYTGSMTTGLSKTIQEDSLGMQTTVVVHFNYTADTDAGAVRFPEKLAYATVTVFDSDGALLCQQSDALYVGALSAP